MPRRKRTRGSRRRRRRQRGRGIYMQTGKMVYDTLKAAGQHARRMKPTNIFRKVTQSRFGMHPAMIRRMYDS